MESVGDRIRWLVEEHRRFVSVEEGWSRFLHHLCDRQGVGLNGSRRERLAEIDTHLEYIDDFLEDPDSHLDDGAAARLMAFGQREDVIEAFKPFREKEGLPSP